METSLMEKYDVAPEDRRGLLRELLYGAPVRNIDLSHKDFYDRLTADLGITREMLEDADIHWAMHANDNGECMWYLELVIETCSTLGIDLQSVLEGDKIRWAKREYADDADVSAVQAIIEVIERNFNPIESDLIYPKWWRKDMKDCSLKCKHLIQNLSVRAGVGTYKFDVDTGYLKEYPEEEQVLVGILNKVLAHARQYGN